jgi:Zinc knuckle
MAATEPDRASILRELDTSFKNIITLISKALPSDQIKDGNQRTNIPIKQAGPVNSRKEVDKPGVYGKIMANIRSFTDIIDEPKSKTTPNTVQNHQTPPVPLVQNVPICNPNPKLQAYRKLNQIRENQRNGVITCYRCGEHNHLSSECHNAPVCFACGKLRHRSKNCRSITLLPPSTTPVAPIILKSLVNQPPIFPTPLLQEPVQTTPKPMDSINEALEFPIMKFYFNPANINLQATLSNSVVIIDEHQLGPLYIQAHLSQRFTIAGFHWIARAISNNIYLLDPPNPLWKASTLELGSITLGGIRFPVEAYNNDKHDNAGHPPLPIWVKITCSPYRFFKKFEFERIADELSGSLLLEVDPRSSNHLDFTSLRLKLGVSDLDVIPPFRKLKFTDNNGIIRFFTLFFEIDHEANMLMVDSTYNSNQNHKTKIY